MWRFLFFLLLLTLVGLANFGIWWSINAPRPLGGPAIEMSNLRSLSFAPFRKGQSPLSQDYPSPQEIEADLKILSGKTQGIRTYTSREGLEIVPALARRYDLKVTLGAWLGTIAKTNEAEIAALIKLANDYPDTVERVIIGNEVLLRRDLPIETLIQYIRRVKAAIKQPVTYADVWEFWLKYPQLLKEVDFVTVHSFPIGRMIRWGSRRP